MSLALSHLYSCVGYYKSTLHIFLLVATNTLLDVVRAKPKFMLHIVGGVKFFFKPFVSWSRNPMLASTDFCIAQNTSIGLHCPILLNWVGEKFSNVSRRAWQSISKTKCGMSHAILCGIQKLLYLCTLCSSIRAINGVVHFVESTWVAISTRWQIKLPFSRPKQLWAIQGTIPSVKILGPRIRSHGICQQLRISIAHSNLHSRMLR